MNILEMKVNDILMLEGLAEVAKEAKEAAEIISKAYSKAFGINQNSIEVWHDRNGYNREYLTHSGFWQARYLHQSYDVECTPDGIYEYLKAEYLIKNGYIKMANESSITPECQKAAVVPYFRTFVERAKKLISSKPSEDAIKNLDEELFG